VGSFAPTSGGTTRPPDRPAGSSPAGGVSLDDRRDVVLEVLIGQLGHLDLELIAPPEELAVPLVVGDRPPGVVDVDVHLGVQRMPVGRSLRPDQDLVDLSHYLTSIVATTA